MLANDLLIVTGALVGSSGAILSIIMCRAMNRSIVNVIFGGFGHRRREEAGRASEPVGEVTEAHAVDVAQLLCGAKRVIVVPGYGMAVARAQHAVFELTEALAEARRRGAIRDSPRRRSPARPHERAPRRGGVPYDIVLEMDEINRDFAKTDVGPRHRRERHREPGRARRRDRARSTACRCSRCGRPTTVVVLKRGMAAGYAGVENPLCYIDEHAHALRRREEEHQQAPRRRAVRGEGGLKR